MKNTKITIFTVLLFFALSLTISPFLISSQEKVLFLAKAKNFSFSFLQSVHLLSVSPKIKMGTTYNARAAYPPSVNSLPTCSFSTSASPGEIFAKNSFCSWADYKCTLTNYNQCDGWADYYNNPAGDACFANSYTETAVISVTPGAYTYCYNVLRSNGSYYAVACDFCVVR